MIFKPVLFRREVEENVIFVTKPAVSSEIRVKKECTVHDTLLFEMSRSV